MEKLFQALRDRHPGCEVLDVRFTVDRRFIGPSQSIEMLDEALAGAIRDAEPSDISQLM